MNGEMCVQNMRWLTEFAGANVMVFAGLLSYLDLDLALVDWMCPTSVRPNAVVSETRMCLVNIQPHTTRCGDDLHSRKDVCYTCSKARGYPLLAPRILRIDVVSWIRDSAPLSYPA